MSYLWVFRRRPCCMVRYQHGGAAAIYPRQEHASIDVATPRRVASAGDVAAFENNVLIFPSGAPDKAVRDSKRSSRKIYWKRGSSGPKHRD